MDPEELKCLIRKIEESEYTSIEQEHMFDLESDSFITVKNDKAPFGKNYLVWKSWKELVQYFKEMSTSVSEISGEVIEAFKACYGA